MKKASKQDAFFHLKLVLAAGFEPATSSFGGKHSIQLSYASKKSRNLNNNIKLLTRHNRNMFDPDGLNGAFAVPRLNTRDGPNIVHSIDDLSKDRVFIIERRLTL